MSYLWIRKDTETVVIREEMPLLTDGPMTVVI